MDEILKSQKTVIRLILNLNYRKSIQERFKDLNISTVYSQYISSCINNHVRDNWPRSTYEHHDCNTQNKDNLIVERHRL